MIQFVGGAREKARDAMRTGQAILGIVLVLAGGVWFLQGIRILPGSFMTGSRFWMIVGALLMIVGIVLLLRPGRRPAGGA
jgi:uncharacterized membrane protein